MINRYFDFIRNRCGNFCLTASLLCVPVIMGAALSVDYGHIQHGRHSAHFALDNAMESSFLADGDLDTEKAHALYASGLSLAPKQTSTPPVFTRRPDGSWTGAATTVTQLTFGGILLPKTYNSTIKVSATASILAAQ